MYFSKSIGTMKQTFTVKNLLVITFCDLLTIADSLPADKSDKVRNGTLSTCTSSDCILAVFRVESNIDYNVSPCVDFYKFVCGKFKRKKPFHQDNYMVNSTSEMVEEQMVVMRHAIENIDSSNDSKPLKFVQRFYNSCINLQYRNDDTINRFLYFIDYAGGWPVLGRKWHRDRFSLYQTFATFQKRGLAANYLYKLSLELDPFKAGSFVLTIDEPELEFPKEILLDRVLANFQINEYYKYMRDIVIYLGADIEHIPHHLNKSLEFELTLLNYMLSKDQWADRNSSTIRTYVLELQLYYPSIDWPRIINNVLNEDVHVTFYEPVIVKSPEYLKGLNNLIGNIDKETLANYLLWKATAESVPFLSDELRLRHLHYNAITLGQTQRRPLWRECVETTNKYFPAVTSLLYIKTVKYSLFENAAAQLFDKIKLTVDIAIQKSDWIEETYKNKLREKIKSISDNMEYWIRINEEELTKYYPELIIYSENYYESMLNVLRHNREFFLRKFNHLLSLTEDWINGLNTPFHGASYSHTKNSISLPVGILNELNSNSHLPYYTRFAGIGVMIAHEISHAYDRTGRKSDRFGKFHNWCQSSCDQYFRKRDHCVIEQYNNYKSAPSVEARNYIIQEQNIADVEGVNIAYKAYDRYLLELEEERQLPTLNYSNHQMFWIWYASLHCTNYRPNVYKNLIKHGFYSDYKFRVNNPLRNSYYFASDFNCKVGDSMYLDKTQRCINP